jgi:hypothetical protein
MEPETEETQIVPVRCQNCNCLSHGGDDDKTCYCDAGKDIGGTEYLDDGDDLVKRIETCGMPSLAMLVVETSATEKLVTLYTVKTEAKAVWIDHGVVDIRKDPDGIGKILNNLDGNCWDVNVKEKNL